MDKKIQIFGLMIGCPFLNPVEDCVLNKYRKLPGKDMLDVIESMDDEEINQILSHHCDCSRERSSK